MTKPKKESWCAIHGKQHALSSGLCTHPKCLGNIIGTHCKSSKWVRQYWKIIQKLGAEQDCYGWTVMRLLEEEQKDGKKPTINSTWLYYNLRKYVWSEHKKSDIPIDKILPTAQNKMEASTSSLEGVMAKFKGNEDVVYDIINRATIHHSNSHSFFRDQVQLEDAYAVLQLKQHIVETYGEVWLLYFTDSITLFDVRKMAGLSLGEIYDTKARIIHELSEEFKEDYQK